MSKVLLFPGCASSPSDIAAREQETGLVAVRKRGSRLVIRMVPELHMRVRQSGRATSVSVGPELPGVA